MARMPKYGESYFYIDDKGKIVSRRNSVQDIDIRNAMDRNYYFSEAKARLDLAKMRISRKDTKSE